ncbi:MAG TPA: sigma-70 family RNA polymerase sigma factor [Nannocystaceae bacterium]|nr:sigma-70 family RNA polymerase sigma factor [Nannocystaceae bacterium]
MTDLDDDELLTRWRAGDRAAGERLFTRHVKSLFRFFRSKLDDAVAEDLTQATFLAATAARDSFRGDATLRTFLFAIARKQLLMHYRSRPKRDREVALDTMSACDLGASPSSLLRGSEEQRLLLTALRQIPIDFQIAVELYYWEGMSTVAIAQVLEVAEGTVRSRLARARERLAELIAELAVSPQIAERTNAGFEDWARSLAQLDRAAS